MEKAIYDTSSLINLQTKETIDGIYYNFQHCGVPENT